MAQHWFERIAKVGEGWIGLVAFAGAAWVFVAMSDPGEVAVAAPPLTTAPQADAEKRP